MKKHHIQKWVVGCLLIFAGVIFVARILFNTSASTKPQEDLSSLDTIGTIVPAASNQCPSDANKLIAFQRQTSAKETAMVSQMVNMPNMSNMPDMPRSQNATITLSDSVFSHLLHTCVAEIQESIVKDKVITNTMQIYITSNDKIIAQYSNPDRNKTDFMIPLHPNSVVKTDISMNDWMSYEKMLGLR